MVARLLRNCNSLFASTQAAAAFAAGANGALVVGTRVKTIWTLGEGGDGNWYFGTVKAIYADDHVKVQYDDGDRWTGHAMHVYSLREVTAGGVQPRNRHN